MAEIDAKVMKFVEEALKKSPKIQLEDLFDRAKKVSKSIRDLSKRQFNARYPLQVKRRKSQATRKRAAGRKKSAPPPSKRTQRKSSRRVGEPRDAIRQVFLQFATDITGAEERKDLVRVLADVDLYVDQVLKGMA